MLTTEEHKQIMKIGLDHVHWYVKNADYWKKWFINVMGFHAIAGGHNDHTYTEIVKTGSKDYPIIFVISSPLSPQSPVAKFLEIHPPGVADIAFRVNNLKACLEKIKNLGTVIQEPMKEKKYTNGYLQWSKIISQTGLIHSLFERRGDTSILPENWIEKKPSNKINKNYFLALDHLVLNVPQGELNSTIDWYNKILGFQKKQFFKIETPQSGLYSQVMFHPVSNIQLPINEPISKNSQIQEFLDINNGSGIQHIALRTNKITEVIKQLRKNGLKFLKVPDTYYEQLTETDLNLKFDSQEWKQIVQENILLDQEENKNQKQGKQNHPLLLQIFTEPIFEQPTFFFEIIERREQAQGFGEGNFKALFEAIEREQMKRGTLINNSGKNLK
ncbi:4-hydroxyphenylpyruvate dioxygenase [Crocosphaera subtropica ATCC 51142]|uniref:4-hydroxyphenylpyruvate dioxygenase n=1 Tax=Crocosphaera subtropica (strain ATCC 51142 / BH68) TaxID=43989 RepID=B1WVS4_CROS5|nr:4-hydroxyphenylpyruvate dioxygenase [Crocosphaera subtropica]ACB50661.1 4-hydroxyphenylpyruvate dioxygenase [Crocosphaera subtropica ATCC 51142]